MESKRILVTGGCGFIGRWISKSLVEKGHQVYIIDDLSGGFLGNIEEFKKDLAGFFHVDLSDTNSGETDYMRHSVERAKPEIVFHLAASAREGASFFDPVKMYRTNIGAYVNVLEASIKTGYLNKVVLFSSMSVYGDQNPPFDESQKREPIDIYGVNKAAMESTTEMLSEVHDFRYTILRPHNVWGPFQSMKDKYRNVVMIMMNKILRKEPLIIYGDGNQQRSFSFVDNSIDCYIRAMNENCDGEVINIGGKDPITINKLAELVCNAMNVDNYPIEYVPSRHGEVLMAYTTIKKSEKLLGYKEKVNMKESMEVTAKWAEKQGPQEWTTDKLELWNSKAPIWWK